MPIPFSIAGLRAVNKRKPQIISGNNQLNQNQNPDETKVANNNNNKEALNTHKSTASQLNQTSVTKPSQHLRRKYPGSGKLTITQKKGKTGYTESIIHRVPIRDEDYDSSDDEGNADNEIFIPHRFLLQNDEDIFMDQLDAEITRQEEKELLERWNDEILVQEEADLMKRLLINIEHAEYREQCAAKPSVVTAIEDPKHEPEETPPIVSVQVPKNNTSSKLVFQPTTGEPPSIPSGVEIMSEVDFCAARITVPRFLDQEHKILAFTRAEFYTGVVQTFEKDMLAIAEKSLYGWDVRLLVSDEDPFSYILEARGQREALHELKRHAQFWIQDRIHLINSRLLLQDGASVVITTGVNPRLTDEEIKTEKANYNERVVSWTEKQFGWIDQGDNRKTNFLNGWKVKVQFKVDLHKFVVTANGTTEMLSKLQEFSKNWVESESLYAHSFESDPLQPSSSGAHIKKIRMTFGLTRYVPLGFVNQSMKKSKTELPLEYSKCGVWLSGIKDGARLAFMMGGPDVIEKGCSLLAIDEKECNTSEDVEKIYSEARDKASNIVTMTVCLSRYTDFAAIPDFVDLYPRRLDGKPFKLSDYEKPDLISTRMVEAPEDSKAKTGLSEESAHPVDSSNSDDVALITLKKNKKKKTPNTSANDNVESKASSTKTTTAKSATNIGKANDSSAKKNAASKERSTAQIARNTRKANDTSAKTNAASKTRNNATSKESSIKTATAKTATNARKTKLTNASNVNPYVDSNSNEPTLHNERKNKRIPKKKDSTSKTIATTNPGNPGKRVAETVVAGNAPIPKKARVIQGRNSIADRPIASSSAPSANRSQTGTSGEVKPDSRQEKANAEKTKPIPRAAVSRQSGITNSSGRAASHGAAPDPFAELHSASSKPSARQKRVAVTQPTEEQAGKKHKGSSTKVNSNVERPLPERPVPEPAIPRRDSDGPNASGLLEELEFEFPHIAPIGAYFRTEGSKCKVFSVFKKGNAAKTKKIMPGTVAIAISIAGTRQSISTHDELREQYERARDRGSKIHIFFVNSDVVSHPSDPHSERDWTENGFWTGRFEGDGWAGGAHTKKGVSESILKANKTSSHPTPRKHKVRFSDSNAVKFFVAGSATDQWHDTIATPYEAETESQLLSSADILEDAVINHRYPKLIEVLETGMTSDFDIIGHALPKLNNYTKEAVIKEKERERKKDMQAKKKVISIYRSVCRNVEQATKLKSTSAFGFVVKSVKLHKKAQSSNAGRTEILRCSVSVKHGKDGMVEELGSLHETPTKAFVSYHESECRNFIKTCNSQLKLDQRELCINFREGAKGDSGLEAKIGSFTIPFGEIDLTCTVDEPFLKRGDLKPGRNKILSKGTVEIEFYKVKNDEFHKVKNNELKNSGDRIYREREKKLKEYLKRQREKLANSLNEQISFIKRFNKEFCGGRMRLTANIQSIGNVTPLNAAIELRKEGMVKQLLELGADPGAKSRLYGTPILQAMKLKDRWREKLQNLISNCRPSEETEPAQREYDEYSRILQLLKPKQAAPRGVAELLDESDEAEDYSGGVSITSEDDQRKRKLEIIMNNIFSDSPKEAGGLEDGPEANKNFVRGTLRLRYSKECPDISSVKKLIEEAIALKVIVEISPEKFRLGVAAGSQDQDNAMKKKRAPLPETKLSWMYDGEHSKDHVMKPCHFDGKGKRGCNRGDKCHFAHIYRVPSGRKARLVLESKELLKVKKKGRFDLQKHMKTMEKDGWYTAGYYDPKRSTSMHFYAVGGNGKANRFGVNWYPTLPEATLALRRVLLFDILSDWQFYNILSREERSRNQASSSSQSNGSNQRLPVLEDRDWMNKAAEFPRCPSGTNPKSIKNGDFWTVEARFGDTIGHQLRIELNHDDVYTIQRNGFYTSAFADRDYKKIVYVEGGNSKINDQGVHWYTSEHEAQNALELVVSASRKWSAARY